MGIFSRSGLYTIGGDVVKRREERWRHEGGQGEGWWNQTTARGFNKPASEAEGGAGQQRPAEAGRYSYCTSVVVLVHYSSTRAGGRREQLGERELCRGEKRREEPEERGDFQNPWSRELLGKLPSHPPLYLSASLLSMPHLSRSLAIHKFSGSSN